MSELVTTARPYARAVFELAEKDDSVKYWSEQLGFMSAIAADPDMQAVLDNPKLSWQQAADLFIQVCGEEVDDQGSNLIKLMAENGRLPVLPEVFALFEQMRSEGEGVVEAEIISAYKVRKNQEAAIAKALMKRLGKSVKLTSRIDKSLMGGAIIRAGDLVIDGSLKGQLDKISGALSR
ncbi:MAG TPA: F0F1 ATP synthase subunit delta [Gammaproteobacteria bacterium]|nr:F0F1 ATP synthase subunit delta [Gammaproteobacteria bacterium]